MQEKKEWETPKLGKLDLKNTTAGVGLDEDGTGAGDFAGIGIGGYTPSAGMVGVGGGYS